MFSQLVTDVEALPATTRAFLTAEPRVRKQAVLSHIAAGTISADELEFAIANHFVSPSAELAQTAILGPGDVALFAIVVNQIKRGWDDVFPTLFHRAAHADLRESRRAADLETLCRRLEVHGVGASTCSATLPPAATALLRQVRWRIKVVRLTPGELRAAATAAGAGSSGEFQQALADRAATALGNMVGSAADDERMLKVSLAFARQWVQSVALRRSTRPTHGRLFSDAARYGATGPRATAVAHAVCSTYAAAYIGAAHPGMFTLPSPTPATSTSPRQWAGFALARRARYVVAWPGPLQMAYSAMRNERIDWFAAALCLLPPRILEGQPGWREEANLAGRRIAVAVASVGIHRVSTFWTVAAALTAAAGHGLRMLHRTAVASGSMARNLRHVWGKRDAAAILAAVAAAAPGAEPAIFELVRCQAVLAKRPMPAVFAAAKPMPTAGALDTPKEYPAMLARRLRQPVLRPAEQRACVAAGVCLRRLKLPTEMVCEILKRVRRLRPAGSDAVPLSMGATRLGFNDVVF